MVRRFLLLASFAIAIQQTAGAAPVSQILFELTTLKEHGGASGLRPLPWFPVSASFSITAIPSGHALVSILSDSYVRNVGDSAIATPATPGFSEFAQFLTDGNEQFLKIPRLSPVSERTYFQADPTDGLDFKGYAISLVRFEIIEQYSETLGRDPNKDGFWTSNYIRSRATIEGHPIPEPSSATLAVLVGHARRDRRA